MKLGFFLFFNKLVDYFIFMIVLIIISVNNNLIYFIFKFRINNRFLINLNVVILYVSFFGKLMFVNYFVILLIFDWNFVKLCMKNVIFNMI